jgi:hypothetical protein
LSELRTRTLAVCDLSAVLVRKFSWKTSGGNEENSRAAALARLPVLHVDR